MKLNKWSTLLMAVAALMLVSDSAFAQEAANNSKGLIGLGSGVGIGLAALGGGIGQGLAARGAYESIARNPQATDKIQPLFFVGLAFIESLVLFGLVITFLLQGKA